MSEIDAANALIGPGYDQDPLSHQVPFDRLVATALLKHSFFLLRRRRRVRQAWHHLGQALEVDLLSTDLRDKQTSPEGFKMLEAIKSTFYGAFLVDDVYQLPCAAANFLASRFSCEHVATTLDQIYPESMVLACNPWPLWFVNGGYDDAIIDKTTLRPRDLVPFQLIGGRTRERAFWFHISKQLGVDLLAMGEKSNQTGNPIFNPQNVFVWEYIESHPYVQANQLCTIDYLLNGCIDVLAERFVELQIILDQMKIQ